MASFLALYRGSSIGSADLVAVTSDPEIVARFAEEMLDDTPPAGDPAVEAVRDGKRRALRLVREEVEGEEAP